MSASATGLLHNLPLQLTSFIGREPEIAEVRRLLAATRLLTLSGSAGVGKTRLALQVAACVVDQYREGVWLAELASLSDPSLVPRVVALALALPERSDRPWRDTLVEALRARQVLLILDNCEHLVQACAELVDTLLRACADLRVLATSRQSLHVSGETTWRVPSMTLPSPEHLVSNESLGAYDATRLFLERAAAALPSFAVTDQNRSTIVRICARLDGIPLAIELAAARVGLLDTEQIDQRLHDRFRLLSGGSRMALPRQQTLRATLDWSFALLAEPERLLFPRLAVFAGGFTLEAAEAVCGEARSDVLEPLALLLDKSLVVGEDAAGSRRYRLLEMLREYAWEKLRSAGEEPAIRNRHFAWVLALAEQADANIRGVQQAAWLTRLEQEHDNVRVALACCLGERRDGASAVRLAGALAWFWRMHGHIGEGRRWLRACLAAPDGLSTPYRSRALTGAGLLAYAQADFAAAVELLEESRRLARERHDLQALAWALHGLGRVRHSAGDLEQADDDLEESLNLFRQFDDAAGCAYTLYFVARQARVRGDYVRAADLYAEALAPAQEIGDVWILGWILAHTADLAFVRDELEQAAELYRESLALLHQIRATWPISVCLFGLTGLAGAQGQAERAARLFGAERALRVELGTTTEYLDLGAYEAGLVAARDALGGARFDALAQAGKAMTLDEVVAFALALDDAVQRSAPRSSKGVQSPSPPSLTRREQEVARLIARGMHNREIAAALVISPRTTDTHVMNILTKLGLHTRAQIAAWAVEHRILTEDT